MAHANVPSIETLAHRIGDLLAVGAPKDVCLGLEVVAKKKPVITAARDGETIGKVEGGLVFCSALRAANVGTLGVAWSTEVDLTDGEVFGGLDWRGGGEDEEG